MVRRAPLLLPLLLAAVFAGACNKDKPRDASGSDQPDSTQNTLQRAPIKAAAIAHGGVGSPPSRSDGCRKAVDAALAALEAGADPVDAAVAGVVVMEDDPRFNAGTGSYVRLDGESVQMDASVMDSAGNFGAVAVIEHVQNPVTVARMVVDTPHLVLAADGATRFARAMGIAEYDPKTPEREARSAKLRKALAAKDDSLPDAWKTFDWQKAWNFEKALEKSGLSADDLGGDTVGVAVRGTDGTFGVALSTGGWTLTLRGRVGDVPVIGAGLFANEHGAVATTGSGERIIEDASARMTLADMAAGISPDDAAQKTVSRVKERGSIGVIAIGRSTMSAAASKDMAWAGRELGSDTWLGPDPGDEAAK